MIVGARCAGSSTSETAGLLGFSRTTVSRVNRESCDKQKNPVSGCPVGENNSLMRGLRRMARIMQGNRQATNRQIMLQYNSDVQNGISERTTCQSLSRMYYCNRRSPRVPLLSAKTTKNWLQWVRVHQHWTIEEWKNITWSDISRFLLRHADSRVRIWCKHLPGVNSIGWWV